MNGDSPIRIYRPDGPKIAAQRLVNFTRQIKVALGSAFLSDSRGDKATVIAFGGPGNGKTAFARFIASELQAAGYYVAWLDCLKLSTLPTGAIDEGLSRLSVLVENPERRPLIIVASLVDRLEDVVRENPSAQILLDQLAAWIGSDTTDGRIFLLATARAPAPVVERMSPKLPALVYFDWPSEVEATQFLRMMNVPRAPELVRTLFSNAASQHIVYSTESFIKGATYAWEAFPDLNSLETTDLVSSIISFGTPTPVEQQEQYVRRNRSYILDASLTADDWDIQFEDRVSSEYLEMARHVDDSDVLSGSLSGLRTRYSLGFTRPRGERPFFVGYEDQLRAAAVLAEKSASERKPYSVMIFGIPGTGKSRVPEVLAFDLARAGIRYSLVCLQCLQLATSNSAEEVRQHLDEAAKYIRDVGTGPVMVVFDELDAIAGDRSEYATGSATVAHWVIDLVRWSREREGAVLFIALCNNPASIDPLILAEFQAALYLDPPGDDEAVAVLRHEGVADAQEAVKEFRRLLGTSASGYSLRSIGKAMQTVKQLFGEEWKSFPASTLAEALFANSFLVTPTVIEKYERSNLPWITRSRILVRSLQPQFDRLVSSGTLRDLSAESLSSERQQAVW